MKNIILLGGLSLLLAGSPGVGAQDSPEPEILDTVTIVPTSRYYPQGAAERGVQGKVTLRAELAADGSFSNPGIHASSGSEELDRAALEMAPKLKFKPTSPATDPGPTTALVEIDFRKDTLASLKTKTCADFNQDAAWFRQTFPDTPLSKMPVFDITAGVLALTVDASQRMAVAKSLPRIKERVIAECAESPDSKFLELAIKATKESP